MAGIRLAAAPLMRVWTRTVVAQNQVPSPTRLCVRVAAMTKTALADLYRAYIACLNRQDWANLHRFVADDARHNGRPFGLAGYRAMLERDFEEIPDLQFNIELLICDPPHVASRLRFDCRPKGLFLDLPVNGRRVVFAENVFYQFRDEKNCGGLVGDRQGGDRSAAVRPSDPRKRQVGSAPKTEPTQLRLRCPRNHIKSTKL